MSAYAKPQASIKEQNLAADRAGQSSGTHSSHRFPAKVALASLFAHGCLVLAFVLVDPAVNLAGQAREIPVEVVMEPAPLEKRPAAAGEATQAQSREPRQRPEDGDGENRLPAQSGFTLPFDSGPDSFRAVAVPLPAESGGEATSYQFIVGGMLERVKHYPETALHRVAKGMVVIGFVLDESGRVAAVSLLRSSGEADLDAEGLAVVNRAAPFPPPPPGSKRSFAIEVAFGMGT